MAEVLAQIVERDRRYAADAYRFVFEGLECTLRHLSRQGGHVTGRELLEGIRLRALDQFGAMAPMVFGHWGVHSTSDFGEIVFNLVEAGLMGRQETDTKDDFKGVYDFAEAFSISKSQTSSRTKRPR